MWIMQKTTLLFLQGRVVTERSSKTAWDEGEFMMIN